MNIFVVICNKKHINFGMKKIVFIGAFFTLFGCQKSNFLAGTYISDNNKIDLLKNYVYNTSSIASDTLILKKDSTLLYTNCTMVMKGKWKKCEDTLSMFFLEKRFKIDSINYDKNFAKILQADSVPYKMIIKNSGLVNVINNQDGKKIIHKLKRQNE